MLSLNSPVTLKPAYFSKLRMKRLGTFIRRKNGNNLTLEEYEFYIDKEKKKLSQESFLRYLETPRSFVKT